MGPRSDTTLPERLLKQDFSRMGGTQFQCLGKALQLSEKMRRDRSGVSRNRQRYVTKCRSPTEVPIRPEIVGYPGKNGEILDTQSVQTKSQSVIGLDTLKSCVRPECSLCNSRLRPEKNRHCTGIELAASALVTKCAACAFYGWLRSFIA